MKGEEYDITAEQAEADETYYGEELWGKKEKKTKGKGKK